MDTQRFMHMDKDKDKGDAIEGMGEGETEGVAVAIGMWATSDCEVLDHPWNKGQRYMLWSWWCGAEVGCVGNCVAFEVAWQSSCIE